MFAQPFHRGLLPLSNSSIICIFFLDTAQTDFFVSVLTRTSTLRQHRHCQNKRFKGGKAANLISSLNGIVLSDASVDSLAAIVTVWVTR